MFTPMMPPNEHNIMYDKYLIMEKVKLVLKIRFKRTIIKIIIQAFDSPMSHPFLASLKPLMMPKIKNKVNPIIKQVIFILLLSVDTTLKYKRLV